jgi:hypothetical protein
MHMRSKLLIAFLALLLISCGPLFGKSRLAETKRRGNMIVLAIEQYHADHHEYPTKLELLLPKYIETLPNPEWGVRKWKYSRTVTRNDTPDFELRVNESSQTGDGMWRYYAYYPETKGWEIGD